MYGEYTFRSPFMQKKVDLSLGQHFPSRCNASTQKLTQTRAPLSPSNHILQCSLRPLTGQCFRFLDCCFGFLEFSFSSSLFLLVLISSKIGRIRCPVLGVLNQQHQHQHHHEHQQQHRHQHYHHRRFSLEYPAATSLPKIAVTFLPILPTCAIRQWVLRGR